MTNNEKASQILPPLEEFQKVAFTVDCVIFGYDNEDLKVLTIKCNVDPFKGLPSLLGDFIRPNEDADTAAIRILKYCTGNSDIYVEEVKTFSRPHRHPSGRVITLAFYSLVQISSTTLSDSAGRNLEWMSIEDIGAMAFDHKEILDTCLQQLRVSLREKPIGFELLPKKFSLNQLQTLYEVVLGIELDKRNFRRKLKSLNILVDLKEHQQEVAHRPAKLYRFDDLTFENQLSTGLKFEI